MLNAPNKINVLYLFGVSFLLKILAEVALGPSVFVSLGVVFFFFLGFLIIFIADRVGKPAEIAPPTVESTPIHEDDAFIDLDRLMLEHGLEMKLRRVDDVWQIAFLTHENGVIRIVGMGSAVSILDAMIKAEADFLEKV